MCAASFTHHTLSLLLGSLSVETGDAKGNAASSRMILSPASSTHMRKTLKHPVGPRGTVKRMGEDQSVPHESS